MIHDIYRHPHEYFFVQFCVDATGHAEPLGANQFALITTSKYPDDPFVGVRASKYGLRRRKTATHWAIVHSDAQGSIEILHYGTMQTVTNRKRVIPFADTEYFAILRGTPTYMKVIVSKRVELPRTRLKEQTAS